MVKLCGVCEQGNMSEGSWGKDSPDLKWALKNGSICRESEPENYPGNINKLS